MSAPTRDESGAVAVMTALLMVVLLISSALAVDLGNAFVHKRERQKDTDLATLAGAGISGANIPGPGVGGTCAYGNKAAATDQAVLDIASYLNKQLAPATVTAATLVNCKVEDGEVFYGVPKQNSAGAWALTYNKNQLSLVSPPDNVKFGFANVIGVSDIDVKGISTVEIRSPKLNVLPFYAYSGCDYGAQTLAQPNNGNSADPLMLFAPSETNNAALVSVTPSAYPAGTAVGTPQPIDIIGLNLTGVTDVGFFESGNATTGPPPVTASGTSTPFTINGLGTSIHLDDLPDATRGVTGVQTYWYLRVKKGGQWSTVYSGSGPSPALNAPRLTIGTPPLTCGQGSSSGNFGTIKLDHPPYTGADNVGAANVALGLTSTLGIYPVADRLADGTCSSSQTATILWSASGTNCVDTDTGMSAKVATGGFLGIGSSAPGAGPGLLAKPFTTKCGPGGNTPATTVVKGVTINNDTLSCFFTDASTNVGDVNYEAYAGPAVISSAIYDSPRFGYVPILPVQPANGGSSKYQVVEFRPTFVTDQPSSAVRGDPPSTTNGIVTDSNGVSSVQVIFVNLKALPPPPTTNGTSVFAGTGAKIPLLVN